MESRELSGVEEAASAKALRQCAQETARKPGPQEQSEGRRAVGESGEDCGSLLE